jgi:multiple sugar transport system substrate-binding protein
MSFLTRLSSTSLIILSLFALTGFGCKPKEIGVGDIQLNVELTMWGLWQESSHLASVIDTFEEQTGIKIRYKKIASVAEYREKLLEQFATGRGPDIFVIHHTWVDKDKALIAPAPASIIDERALREEFVEVVASDVLRKEGVYALPISVDTLALFYNKDIFNSAGIVSPPRTWMDFQNIVEQLTQLTPFGTIKQSAATLGTAANINRSADILQLLMLQSGTAIIDSAGGSSSLSSQAAENSLVFYTDFANKSKKVYTWDLQQDYSIDSFTESKAAMTINYSYHIPTIRAKNPRLRAAVAPVPQISDSKKVNFASYWPFAVSKKSPQQEAAWRFLRYLTNTENSARLNDVLGSPPARRDGVTRIVRDPTMGVFAEQALTAVSWPRVDIIATDAIFNNMIDSVVKGAATTTESLRRARDQLNQLSVPTKNDSQNINIGPSL